MKAKRIISILVAVFMLATMFTFSVSAESTSTTLALENYEITTKGLRLFFNEDITALTADIAELGGEAIETSEVTSGKSGNVILDKAMDLDGEYVLTFTATSASGTFEGSKKITFNTIHYDDFESYETVADLGKDDYYKLINAQAQSMALISEYASTMALVKDENNNTWLKMTAPYVFLTRAAAGYKNLTFEFDVKAANSTASNPVIPGFAVYTFHNGVRYWGGKYLIEGFVNNPTVGTCVRTETISTGPLYSFNRKTQHIETFAFVRSLQDKEYGQFYSAAYYNGEFSGEYNQASNPELQTIYYQGYYIGAKDATGALFDNYKAYSATMVDYVYVPFKLASDVFVRSGINLNFTDVVDRTVEPVISLTSNGATVPATAKFSGKLLQIVPQTKLALDTPYKLEVSNITSCDGEKLSYSKEFALKSIYTDDFSGYSIQEDGSYDTTKFGTNFGFMNNNSLGQTNSGSDPHKPMVVNGSEVLYLGSHPWLYFKAANDKTNYTIEYDLSYITKNQGPNIQTAADDYWRPQTFTGGIRAFEMIDGRYNLGYYLNSWNETRYYTSPVLADVELGTFVNCAISKQAYTGDNLDCVFSMYEAGEQVFSEIGKWKDPYYTLGFAGYIARCYMDNVAIYEVIDLSSTPAPEFLKYSVTKSGIILEYTQEISNGSFALTQNGLPVEAEITYGKNVTITPEDGFDFNKAYEFSATNAQDSYGRKASDLNKAFVLRKLFEDDFSSYNSIEDLDAVYNVSYTTDSIKSSVSEYVKDRPDSILLENNKLVLNKKYDNGMINFLSNDYNYWKDSKWTFEVDLEADNALWVDVLYNIMRGNEAMAVDSYNNFRVGLASKVIQSNEGATTQQYFSMNNANKVNLKFTTATGSDYIIYVDGVKAGTGHLADGFEFGFKLINNTDYGKQYIDNILAYELIELDTTAKNIFIDEVTKTEEKISGNVIFANYQTGFVNCDILVAAYNEYGKLLGISIVPASWLTSGIAKSFEIECDTSKAVGIKAFMWSGADVLAPITNSIYTVVE